MSGPLVIGPMTAVAGTALHYSSLPADTVAIYIQNYSKLTLLVSFGASQPTATDSLNNQYDGVLAPGGRDVFYVQSRGASASERGLNAMGAFTGNVWIMPVDRTGTQANTGSVSQMADIWLSAYGPYDPLPPFPGGMPLNVDLSSQPRIVSLPMGLSHWNQFQWLATDPSPFDITTMNMSPAQLAGAVAPIYFYLARVDPLIPAANGQFLFFFQIQYRDNTNANVGSPFIFTRGAVMSTTGATSTPWEFFPIWPLAIVGPFPATAVKAVLQIATFGGTRVTCEVTVSCWMDANNIQGIQDIGQSPFNGASKPIF